jgi:hypothetical protein
VTNPDIIIEAAARAMANRSVLLRTWDTTPESSREWYREIAEVALAAVTPLIEANALEAAAKLVDEYTCRYPDPFVSVHLADAIRAMNRVLNLEISRGLSHD